MCGVQAERPGVDEGHDVRIGPGGRRLAAGLWRSGQFNSMRTRVRERREASRALVSTFAVAPAFAAIAHLAAIPADVLDTAQHVTEFDATSPLIRGRLIKKLAAGYPPVPGVPLPRKAEKVFCAAAHGSPPLKGPLSVA